VTYRDLAEQQYIRRVIVQKSAKVALFSLAVIVVAIGSAAVGFYVGLRTGSTTIKGMAEINKTYDDLSGVRSSMVALGKSDLNLSQHQLALHLREALFDLGALSKSEVYFQCTDRDKRVLAEAAGYVATHPDPILFGPDPFLMSGMKFCESRQVSQGVTVSYMTTGKK
jgi:hypothetical protein